MHCRSASISSDAWTISNVCQPIAKVCQVEIGDRSTVTNLEADMQCNNDQLLHKVPQQHLDQSGLTGRPQDCSHGSQLRTHHADENR